MLPCDLCGFEEIELEYTNNDEYIYHCERCGTVKLSGSMTAVLKSNPDFKDIKYKLSGVTRYRTENNFPLVSISGINVTELIDSYFVPRNITQKLNLILKYISDKSKFPGEIVNLDPEIDYPIGFCKNIEEFNFYLLQLELQNMIYRNSEGYTYQLTLDGWNRIDELERKTINKNQVFIAMWFDSSLSEIYEKGFHKAIRDSGYEPMKIDLKEHNNKIDDEIISEIRNSAFLVADFTGHRGGVYFEAGFAYGLGIPVIWTCRQDDIGNLHFDTRQYNHIDWNTYEDLYYKLLNRINATITIKN